MELILTLTGLLAFFAAVSAACATASHFTMRYLRKRFP